MLLNLLDFVTQKHKSVLNDTRQEKKVLLKECGQWERKYTKLSFWNFDFEKNVDKIGMLKEKLGSTRNTNKKMKRKKWENK